MYDLKACPIGVDLEDERALAADAVQSVTRQNYATEGFVPIDAP